ncbi:MAG TPA: putative lipid II flippase FtsW [Solibacterales bacterium]|nr:putative lipid II flippase FtsW [Bryobacterales bacterium]
MAQKLKTDHILFATVVMMVFFGLVMVYSASSVMADLKMGHSYYFVARQLFWVVIAVGVMMTLKMTHYRKLQHPAVAFPAMSIVLMMLIAVYVLDAKQHRWIRFGFIGIQPSELAKPALALFLAYFIALRARAINNRYTLLPALLAVGLVTVSVVVADLGTAVVLMLSAATVFFVAGLDWRYVMIAIGIGLVGCVAAVAAKPYRLTRIIGYIDPEYKIVYRVDSKLHTHVSEYLKRSLTTKDTSYQSEQSKIAVGAGGPMGQGLSMGKQKLLYLPEAHTDFIYAVVGEELGLFGTVGVLLAFGVILWRGIRATVLIPDEFGRYLALGVTTMLVVQGLMNISVVLGMMPTKGIPLPMISFGGSSLLSTLASLGILMNVSEHAG